MRSVALILLISVMVITAQAQTNLVPNGDFEENTGCPQGTGSFNKLKLWKKCSSPDYFHVCAFSQNFTVPKNGFGYQWPFSGSAYVGLALYNSTITFREYIKVKLIEDLVKDSLYYLSIYYSIADSAGILTSSLDALLTTYDIACPQNSGQITLIPQLKLIGEQIPIYDTVNWLRKEIYFIPDSNYRYIVIGNFNSDSESNIIYLNQNNYAYAYYYIDSVSLKMIKHIEIPLDQKIQILNAITPNLDSKNDMFKLMPNVKLRLQKVNIIIYNRWGQVIFQSNDINFQWDGTFKGKPVELGAYPYIIEYTLINEQTSRTQTGWIHVLY